MLSHNFIFDNSIPFKEKARRVFELQKEHNLVYHRFCKAMGSEEIASVKDIPLLPIEAFKEAEIVTPKKENGELPDVWFQSSGTSRMVRSKHFISDPGLYRGSILKGMNQFYDLEDYVIWAYTPRYNENPHSSLIWMLRTLIEEDHTRLSKFLELDKPLDEKSLKEITKSGKKLMLFGAAFGFLDLIEMADQKLPPDTIVMETGGMKTHRLEISKVELHQKLAKGFGLPKSQIHSEYGMTELLSQAYSFGDEWFACVPWMNVSIRDPKNPMKEVDFGEEGLIGIIDLANLYSCSFMLTGDKGIHREDGKFQVLGRWNPKNLRGCNFLIERD
ncbi:hypothetical protein [Gracilimonas sp.]|uniref:LuxE/PaaK family acyltransferase n=1 Tax=Gracilimonas sp. TaxID=1974203 RepID=UPI002871B676|nr:hypothetical protein [Gracilimonas sp.]